MATAVLRGGHAWAAESACPPRQTGVGMALPNYAQLEPWTGHALAQASAPQPRNFSSRNSL
jgi:hypothetical protein